MGYMKSVGLLREALKPILKCHGRRDFFFFILVSRGTHESGENARIMLSSYGGRNLALPMAFPPILAQQLPNSIVLVIHASS